MTAGIRHADKGADVPLIGDVQWDKDHVIDDGAIEHSKLASAPAATVLGSVAGGSVSALTAEQINTILATFSTSGKGLVPQSPGGSTMYLRADGTWSGIAAGGAVPYYDFAAQFTPPLDGTTSALTAFKDLNTSLLASGGGIVYLGPNTFTLARDSTNSWCFKLTASNVLLLGAGKDKTRIKAPTGLPNSSVATLALYGNDNIHIADMTIDGQWGATVGVTTTQAGINNTTQTDPKNYGLQLRSVTNSTFARLKVTQTYGDGIWCGSGGNVAGYQYGCSNLRFEDIDIDITARDGISLAQKVEGLTFTRGKITNIFASAFDTEPVDQPIRRVNITFNYFGVWWDASNIARSNNLALTISGGKSTIPGAGNYAEEYHVEGNKIYGGVLIQDAENILLKNNRILCDNDNYSYAPVTVQMHCDNVIVEGNRVYDRTTVPSGRNNDACIQVQCYSAGAYNGQPLGVTVRDNTCYARNGRYGIKVEGTGGFATQSSSGAIVQGVGGTATAVTDLSMTCGSATWTTNQWSGYWVRIGTMHAPIASNTATVLTLWGESNGGAGDLPAWLTWNGKAGTTPSPGTFEIYSQSGVVDVVNNTVDCTDDGYGAGSYGIYVTAFRSGMRVRVRGNKVKNATTAGLRVTFNSSRTFKYLEITDNHVWDDQRVQTCTQVLSFSGTPLYEQMIIRGNHGCNISGTALTAVSGLTTGTWLVQPGITETWEGYGAPTMTAANGSRYQRLDGAGGSTLYARAAGAWTAYA